MRQTHLDSLASKLQEPRIRRILEPVLAGTLTDPDPTYNDDASYVRDLSCGSRTLCTSCSTRRMVSTAAHMATKVLSDVPVRQWVLSVPHEPGEEHLNNYLEYEFVFE